MSHPRIVLNEKHFDRHGHAYPLDVADCVKPFAPEPEVAPYYPPDVASCIRPWPNWPNSVPATETPSPAELPESSTETTGDPA